jgi:hypothetical protein
MEQIMKVDTQALLNTIQELEKRLTEHQRQDNIPPWAQALQSRMEQLEKSRSADVDVLVVPKSIGTESVNLSTLTMEERIIAKIRSEFETKIGTSQLHFEGIISSYSLELERLHKLLMIRPTTSELQQVVLNVQQQEHRTQQHLQEMQNVLMANVRDRISEEMIGCLLELKNARAAGEEGSRLIAKQVSDFAAQMGELREGAQNSIIALQEAQTESKELMNAQKGEIEQSRRQLKDEIHKVNTITVNLKNELKTTSELLTDQSAKFDDTMAKMDERLKTESQRLQRELQVVTTKLGSMGEAQVAMETTLEQVKFNFEREMDDLRVWRKALDQKSQESDRRQFNTEKQVAELISKNFETQIKKAYDECEKLAAELEQLSTLCHQTLTQDIKSNTLKISLLQEQCNIAIPKTLSEHALRMTDLYENLRSTSESIDVLKSRHDQEDELIASLMPLKDRVAFLADAKTAHENELNNVKEGITNCMDANSEFARRMEEMEESMETFDESINSRMNRIRDTLLDTLLDKHNETTAAVRNARENLDVMSMAAGEAGMSIVGGGGGLYDGPSSAGGVTGGGKGQRGSIGLGGTTGPRMTVVHREADNGVGPGGQSGPAGGVGSLKRLQSYRVPSMQGQVVQGNNITPISPRSAAAAASAAVSANPSPQSQMSQPAPALGVGAARRQSSIRIQHQTQTILSQHRKILGGPSPQQSSGNFSVGNDDVNTGRSSVHINVPQTEMSDPSSPEQPPFASNSSGHLESDIHPPMDMSPVSAHGAVTYESNGTASANHDAARSSNPSPMLPSHSAPSYSHQIPTQQHHQAVSQHQHQHHPHLNFTSQPQAMYPQSVSAPPSAPAGSRTEVISDEYNHLLNHHHGAMDEANVEHEAQFLADLCLNFEDISLKRKKVSSLPFSFCQSIAQVTRAMAELIAEQADFEMVEQSIAAVNGPLVVQDVNYDESFVVNTRQRKQDEYVELVLHHVNEQVNNGGVLRSDARQLFVALIRKALDMFMSKHNQVLIAGNSRLGRVKIPSCIACDRPLVEKIRLDRSIASPPPGTRGLMEQSAATLRSGWSNQGGGILGDEDPASHERVFSAAQLENSQLSNSGPGKGILGRGLLSAGAETQRPKTMGGTSRATSSSNSGKVLKSSTMRPNPSSVL